MSIYVGNLSSETTEDDLKAAFAAFGEVTGVNIIKDKFTGQPRGFAFVEMAEDDAADKAVAALNGTEFQGRALNVSGARARGDGGGRQGGGGYGRGGGGGRSREPKW